MGHTWFLVFLPMNLVYTLTYKQVYVLRAQSLTAAFSLENVEQPQP